MAILVHVSTRMLAAVALTATTLAGCLLQVGWNEATHSADASVSSPVVVVERRHHVDVVWTGDSVGPDRGLDGVSDSFDEGGNGDSDGPDWDLDGVPDSSDLCLGSDRAGDSDRDGVCNDIDRCRGDDDIGDLDKDGTCDDLDDDDDDDGVDDHDDLDPLDPNLCADSDGDGCDDCTITGANRSGGDVANDGPACTPVDLRTDWSLGKVAETGTRRHGAFRSP